MYLIGYDIGSSSVKGTIIEASTGKCIASAFYPKTEMEIKAAKPGWAEQNPETWWDNLKAATKKYSVYQKLILQILRPLAFHTRCTDW